MMHLSTSLFHIDIDVQCGKNWMEDKLCVVAKDLNGHHTLQQASQLSCAVSTQACQVMTLYYYCSFIIFFCFGFAIIFHFLAALFLYNYWYQSKLPKMKKAALWFFCLAPLLSGIGFVGWSAVTP